MKLGKLMIGVLFILGLFVMPVNAAVSPDYDITAVKVNGKEVSESDVNFITVERGDAIDLEVWINGQANGVTKDDVRVKAWIGGYEYGDVAEKTKFFKIEKDGSYKKSLTINLPDDLEADSSGNAKRYTLHVEAFDSNNEERKSYVLKIDEKMHDLRIVDVIFRPGTSVNANDMLFATVRVENMGDRAEEDIQVKLTIPELGFVARDYIDELVPHDNDNDDEEKSGDIDLFGRVPKNAETGKYSAKVELIYSRGHEVLSEDYELNVEGISTKMDTESIINVDSTLKNAKLGESASFRVMIANFGDQKITYSGEVLGVGAWGSASVDPAFASIDSGDTGEFFVKVAPSIPGEQGFTVKIKANDKVVKELNLKVNAETASSWGDLRRGLEIGFAVLAILLVVLGLIIAFTKLKGGNDKEEPELGNEEANAGQTYY